MEQREGFRLAARVRSFRHAFRGLAALVSSQHNAWIHALATALVVALGVALEVGRTDWALLLIACGGVWAAEGLNTALEWLCDALSPEHHPLVGRAKDVAAAAVLLAALAAAGVGALVFGPPLLALLGR